MPFGATIEDGATRFRLWAPGARNVSVVVSHAGIDEHPLAALDDGWFEVRIAGCVAGTRYAFRCDDAAALPDPASRSNPDGVHAASEVIDPLHYDWRQAWHGRPWEEAVVYELHVGTFTSAGTFAAAAERMEYLAALGVTAIELMPVAAFPGQRNWGYDGVLPYAPARCYGTPDDLKRLVDAAHAHGLMMLLDVVYNHFGPEGNYLGTYAPAFFDSHRQTPWGSAINFDSARSRTVRDFFIHNALYWVDEYRFDGLRVDAVHAIEDGSTTDIVSEITDEVRRIGDREQRHVHVVLENDANEARRLQRDVALRPQHATAQWNDDIHHALHVLLTAEVDGYYADYAADPLRMLGRCLAEGFAFQGEASAFRDGKRRGEPSAQLPATAFVNFTQTHDQVGNRAFGERLSALADPRALRAVTACVLLAPSPPMLFMGEEFAATTPFLYFCDFGPPLAEAVARGRRAEFGRFERFGDAAGQAQIPDPNALATFEASKLDWSEIARDPGIGWLDFYRRCLDARRSQLVPRLAGAATRGSFRIVRDGLLQVNWELGPRSTWHLAANFGNAKLQGVPALPGSMVFETDVGIVLGGEWPAHGVAFSVEDSG